MIARLFISQSSDLLTEKIEEELRGAGLSKNHPDVLFFPKDTKLGIEQGRLIKGHFSLKPYSAKGRGVIIEDASLLTPDAQNALLKTLEEPPKEAVLILGATSDSKFLPTILSRCQVVRLHGGGDNKKSNDYTEDIEKLITATNAEKFEYIEKLKEKEEFLYSLTKHFHKKLPSNSDFVKQLLQAESWANQNVNIRAILEYLMLVMPTKE